MIIDEIKIIIKSDENRVLELKKTTGLPSVCQCRSLIVGLLLTLLLYY